MNITSAEIVIHFDPWWNNAVEDQATDRAHRIGQKNTIHVIKLITKGTIEEKIFEIQEKKNILINSIQLIHYRKPVAIIFATGFLVYPIPF